MLSSRARTPRRDAWHLPTSLATPNWLRKVFTSSNPSTVTEEEPAQLPRSSRSAGRATHRRTSERLPAPFSIGALIDARPFSAHTRATDNTIFQQHLGAPERALELSAGGSVGLCEGAHDRRRRSHTHAGEHTFKVVGVPPRRPCPAFPPSDSRPGPTH